MALPIVHLDPHTPAPFNAETGPFYLYGNNIIRPQISDLTHPLRLIKPTVRSQWLKITDYLGVVPGLGSVIGVTRLISGTIIALISSIALCICSKDSRKWAALNALAMFEAEQGALEMIPCYPLYKLLIDLFISRNNYEFWHDSLLSAHARHYCYITFDIYDHAVVKYHPKKVTCYHILTGMHIPRLPELHPWDLLSEAEKDAQITHAAEAVAGAAKRHKPGVQQVAIMDSAASPELSA